MYWHISIEQRKTSVSVTKIAVVAIKGGGGSGTYDYNELANQPMIGGVRLSGNQTLADYGLWNLGLATQDWVDSRLPIISDGFHPLGGRDDLDFKARELRGTTLSLLKSGLEYISLKFEPLNGTGAEPPAPGGSGTYDYNELANQPMIGGVRLSGNQTLADYGLWNLGLATQDWVDSRLPTIPVWAMNPTKPNYAFFEIASTPTTLSGYGIQDGLKLVKATNAVIGNNIDWNSVVFDQNALSISQIATPNHTGQFNHPFSEYGQLLTFGAFGSLFSSQIAISNSGVMAFRGEYDKNNFNTPWQTVYSTQNANLSTADWACKKLTMAKFNMSGVVSGTITLSAETFN